jgi:hypothetical protein
MNDRTPEEAEEYRNLAQQLAKEQGESYLNIYPGTPVDGEGNPISDYSTQEKGVKLIAGEGHKTPIHDIERITSQHGGVSQDWQKVTSEANQNIEMHAYRNQNTGEVVEMKTKEVGPSSKELTEIPSQTDTAMTDSTTEETQRNDAIENRRNERQQELMAMELQNSADMTSDKNKENAEKIEEFKTNADDVTKADEKPDNDGDKSQKSEFKENAVEVTGNEVKTVTDEFKENNMDIQGVKETTTDKSDRPEPEPPRMY